MKLQSTAEGTRPCEQFLCGAKIIEELLLRFHIKVWEQLSSVYFCFQDKLFFPPPITHPSTTLLTLSALDSAKDGLSLGSYDENILGEALGKSLR